MPIVSEFYGIKIMMFWNEHFSPHFYAEYGENKILVDIQKGTVMKGVFPSKQLKLVLAWCEIHKDELMINWANGKENLEFIKINPLV